MEAKAETETDGGVQGKMITKADFMKHTLFILGIEGGEIFKVIMMQILGSTKNLFNCTDETRKGIFNVVGIPLMPAVVDSFIIYRAWFLAKDGKLGSSFTFKD
mmetsp:Transcript_33001/g.67347  ORF Transcript_33001/g.67347 Transcript_33001/m.67347 type:complete len:103 (+) Transcript_33001:699-1007(+)